MCSGEVSGQSGGHCLNKGNRVDNVHTKVTYTQRSEGGEVRESVMCTSRRKVC